MSRRRLAFAVVAAVSLLSAGCAQRLGDRLGTAIGLPVDINEVGTILGVRYDSNGHPQGVLLSRIGGDITLIPGRPGGGFMPHAINDLGVVVGATIIGDRHEVRSRAVTWTRDGGFVDLPLPADTFQSWAAAINNRGDVAFNAFSPTVGPANGAYLMTDGQVVRLSEPAGAPNERPSVAEALNETGTVVGATSVGSGPGAERALQWEAGTRTPRFLAALGVSSHALDINEEGSIVGGATVTPGNDHAVGWPRTEPDPVDLGPGVANALNDLGVVIGQDAIATPPQAVAWGLRTRFKVRLGELVAGRGSNAVALNNTLTAVGDGGGESTYYPVPPLG